MGIGGRAAIRHGGPGHVVSGRRLPPVSRRWLGRARCARSERNDAESPGTIGWETAKAVFPRLGRKGIPMRVDLTDDRGQSRMVARALEEFAGSLLVNNAEYCRVRLVLDRQW